MPLRLRILIIIILAVMGAVSAWYFLTSNEEVLIVDRTDFTLILDTMPSEDEDAISIAQKALEDHYPVSDFKRFFSLKNISKTPYKWILAYSVLENPDITVTLVESLSEEKGFTITDRFIINHTGLEYFDIHFVRDTFNNFRANYLYSPWNDSSFSISMWVDLDHERKIFRHRVLLSPQEVLILESRAKELAEGDGLKETVSCSLIVLRSRLYWRCSSSQRIPGEVYRLDIDGTTGEISGRTVYSEKKKTVSPVGKGQVEELVAEIEMVEGLEDGSTINIYISESHSEKFHIIRSLERSIIREGFSDEADITIYIHRDLFLEALQSDDPASLIIEKSGEDLVTASLETDPLTLTKKGYLGLYESLNLEE